MAPDDASKAHSSWKETGRFQQSHCTFLAKKGYNKPSAFIFNHYKVEQKNICTGFAFLWWPPLCWNGDPCVTQSRRGIESTLHPGSTTPQLSASMSVANSVRGL